jgi:DNA (cytosine-5)-methyltransferase 1
VDNTQNIISFCTGYGGIELGIKRAGVDVRTVVNVEIEAFCCANLVAKIEEGRMDDAPIWTDLKTFPAEIFRGKVHGLIGGYPCQPFSSAGKRKGEDDPRHLWPYIRQHVRAIRPVWCFFENVRGHTTMGLWRVLSDLEEDGYRTEFGLFSAEETGAPHQRIRCFILAKLPDTSGEGLQGDELGGSCDEQVKGLQGTHEPTSELYKVRDEQLAHTASREPRQSQARNGGQDIGGGSEEELADSARDDVEGRDTRQGEVQLGGGCSRDREPTRWPARPGEEQYEWEEPRVTEAQSELGGAVDGLTHRVDRLRLLGNGVVPQTAELAWKTLWRKMNEDND